MPKHNQFIDTVDNVISHGVDHRILHLTSEGDYFDGKHFIVNGKKLTQFASYGYLNLDQDPELIKAMIEALPNYGTQFPISRAYIQPQIYEELESLLEKIFKGKTLVGQSTTAIHEAVIPVLVRNEDAVILDHQVHGSVQKATEQLKNKGIPVELLRHNNLERLEERVVELCKNKGNRKVWYFGDGVYSMYGDYAPVHELEALMNKYPQLMVYLDDAHGMSWTGEHGSGYVLSEIDLHPQLLVSTSLNKAFGGLGGAIVFPDEEMYRKVRTCGPTQIFSTQLPPVNLAGNVASAKVHLSNRIEKYQDALQRKIGICQKEFKDRGLPVVDFNNSPIFYVGVGKHQTGVSMMERLKKEGFYTTIGMFPATSALTTGLRVCINRNHREHEIVNLAKAIEYHLPYALSENGSNLEQIYRSFKMHIPDKEDTVINSNHLSGSAAKLIFKQYQSINEIDKQVWNNLLGSRGTFDWDGLKWLEASYKKNTRKEDNWEFRYFIIKNETGEVILATFCTKAWCKDDIFHHSYISTELEKVREKDPYHMCSEMLMMGSLLTTGEHLYLNKNLNWKEALQQLLIRFQELQHEFKVNQVNLRDFLGDDNEVRTFMINEGYVPVDLPDTHRYTKLDWRNFEELRTGLSKKSRRHLKQQVINFIPMYDVSITGVKKNDLPYLYQLYLNVKSNSKQVNSFDVPFKAFEKMIGDNHWEIITLHLNETSGICEDKPIACMFCYKGEVAYTPLLVGIDYRYLNLAKNYKQILFQSILRGKDLGYKIIHLGYTASDEKRKIGSEVISTTAYIMTKDLFGLKQLENTRIEETERKWKNVLETGVNS